mgnify:CR=1 FL=1
MRRKRIKYVANIDFGYRSITDAKQHIKNILEIASFANRTTFGS